MAVFWATKLPQFDLTKQKNPERSTLCIPNQVAQVCKQPNKNIQKFELPIKKLMSQLQTFFETLEVTYEGNNRLGPTTSRW